MGWAYNPNPLLETFTYDKKVKEKICENIVVKNLSKLLYFRLSMLIRNVIRSMAAKDIKIPVPWGHIAGKEWGSSSGEPWIALHGWLDNCGSFDTLIPHFPEEKHRIIAIGMTFFF